MNNDHTKTGDALLATWAGEVERLLRSGIGYPASSVEGRAMKAASAGRPCGSMVPRFAEWPEEVRATDEAVHSLPFSWFQRVQAKYLDGVDVHRSDLRDAKLFVCGYVIGRIGGERNNERHQIGPSVQQSSA